MKKSVRSGFAGILCVFLLGGMLLYPCAAAQEGDPAVQRTNMSAQGDEAAVIWYQDGVRTDHPSEGKVFADVGVKNHTDAAAVVTAALAVYDTKNCLRLLQRQCHSLDGGAMIVAATETVTLNRGERAALYVWNEMQPLTEQGDIALFSPDAEPVQTAYRAIDRAFCGVFDYLTEVYDPESGGFYTTVSAARYEGYVPSLEATAFVCQMMTKGESGAIAVMPASMRERLIAFFQARQNPDGFFYDTGYHAEDYTERDKIRLYGQCVDALALLGTKPQYTPQSCVPDAALYADAPSSFPAYLATVEQFMDYIRAQSWDTNSWEAGDRAYEAMSYALLLGDSAPYRDALLAFLKERQDEETGYWGKRGDSGFNACSGAFKVAMIYHRFSMCPPRPQAILDSVAETLDAEDMPTAACFVRNPISVIQIIRKYEPEMVQAFCERREAAMVHRYQNYIQTFFRADGGASSEAYMAKTTFGGIPAGLGLCEGDMDGTRQMWIARKDLYQVFGREPDASLYEIHYRAFWDGLLQKETKDKTSIGQTIGYTEDFESADCMETLYGEHWSAPGFGAAIAGEDGNRYLRLTDTSLSGGESVSQNFLAKSTSGTFRCKIRFERPGPYQNLQNDLSYSYLALLDGSRSVIEVHAIDSGGDTVMLKAVSDASDGNRYQSLMKIPIGVWAELSITYQKTGDQWKVTYTVNQTACTWAENVSAKRETAGISRFALVTSPRRAAIMDIDDIGMDGR